MRNSSVQCVRQLWRTCGRHLRGKWDISLRRSAFMVFWRCAKLEPYFRCKCSYAEELSNCNYQAPPVSRLLPQVLNPSWDKAYNMWNGLSRSINQDVADKDRLSRFYYLVEQHSHSPPLHPKSHHGVYFRCVPCALPRWKGLIQPYRMFYEEISCDSGECVKMWFFYF